MRQESINFKTEDVENCDKLAELLQHLVMRQIFLKIVTKISKCGSRWNRIGDKNRWCKSADFGSLICISDPKSLMIFIILKSTMKKNPCLLPIEIYIKS